MHLINLIQEKKPREKLWVFLEAVVSADIIHLIKLCIQICCLDVQIPNEGPLGSPAFIFLELWQCVTRTV